MRVTTARGHRVFTHPSSNSVQRMSPTGVLSLTTVENPSQKYVRQIVLKGALYNDNQRVNVPLPKQSPSPTWSKHHRHPHMPAPHTLVNFFVDGRHCRISVHCISVGHGVLGIISMILYDVT